MWPELNHLPKFGEILFTGLSDTVLTGCIPGCTLTNIRTQKYDASTVPISGGWKRNNTKFTLHN